MSRKRILLYGFIAFAVLFACFIVGLISGQSSRQTPITIVSPDGSVYPTHTPYPTLEPVVVVETVIVPADTPTPYPTYTPYPTVAISSDQDSYRSAVLVWMAHVSNDMTELGTLAQSAEMLDREWMIAIAQTAGRIVARADALNALDPPAAWAPVHKGLQLAMADYVLAMTQMTAGIAELNVDKITSATALMQSGAQKITAAQALIPQ